MKSRERVTLVVVLALLFPAVSLLPAQGPVRPSFEVASVKPNKSDRGSPVLGQSGGNFTATKVSIRELIRVAYGTAGPLEESHVIGGPNWTEADRFDVLAKIPSNAPPQLVALMLRSLLAERFQLVVHTEPRDLPIYALVLARADGRLGPRLRRVQDCGPGAAANAEPSLPKAERCGGEGRSGHIAFGGVPLSMALVTNGAMLREVRRSILDRTRLTGAFEGTLDWSPTELSQSATQLDAFTSTALPAGASIFTALQEQLGLKLEPARGPVDVLVIDHVERPTPD